MTTDTSSTIYAVYPPPAKGLPFLAVILMPDGTVEARQFDRERDAEDFSRLMARGQQITTRH